MMIEDKLTGRIETRGERMHLATMDGRRDRHEAARGHCLAPIMAEQNVATCAGDESPIANRKLSSIWAEGMGGRERQAKIFGSRKMCYVVRISGVNSVRQLAKSAIRIVFS